MAGPATPPAGWYGDPARRHQHRYWDGSQWTAHVADAGVVGSDPLVPAPVPASQAAATQAAAPAGSVTAAQASGAPASGAQASGAQPGSAQPAVAQESAGEGLTGQEPTSGGTASGDPDAWLTTTRAAGAETSGAQAATTQAATTQAAGTQAPFPETSFPSAGTSPQTGAFPQTGALPQTSAFPQTGALPQTGAFPQTGAGQAPATPPAAPGSWPFASPGGSAGQAATGGPAGFGSPATQAGPAAGFGSAAGQAHSTSPLYPAAAAPAPPGRKGRGKWLLISAIAVVVVIGLVTGLLVWAPWRPPPLLQPAGLAAGTVTTSSVEFHWAGPVTGPPPDRYLILYSGSVIGSVPGTVTSYHAAGLAPDTAYSYRVVAERGGKRSAKSLPLVMTTAVPPLSAARLDGTWSVHVKIIRGAASLTGGPGSWNESWQTNAQCPSGPCAVKMYGTLNGHTFKVTLHRAGALYSGKTVANIFPCGSGANSFPINSTLHFQVKVSSADVTGVAWTASGWKGTLKVSSPYTVSGNFFCNPTHQTITLHGTP